jgi:hypothetical protein
MLLDKFNKIHGKMWKQKQDNINILMKYFDSQAYGSSSRFRLEASLWVFLLYHCLLRRYLLRHFGTNREKVPVSILRVLANNQLDAIFHVFIYSLHLSTCFEHQVLIIRRSNCINTLSGMISLCEWVLGMPVLTGKPSSHLHRLIILDDVLIQIDLLMMSTWCSKHVERGNE